MNDPFDPKRSTSAAAALARLFDTPETPPRGSERRMTAAPRVPASVSRSEEDDARSSSKHLAALEALFARPAEPAAVAEPVPERGSKIVSVPLRDDPRREERQKRLAKLMAAEGRAAVTRACELYLNAKLALPETQEVMLKLLDHDRDDRVRWALELLSTLLDEEPPQRRAVLDARLRRLEQDAEDAEVRDEAAALRKKLARLTR